MASGENPDHKASVVPPENPSLARKASGAKLALAASAVRKAPRASAVRLDRKGNEVPEGIAASAANPVKPERPLKSGRTFRSICPRPTFATFAAVKSPSTV